MRIDLLKTTPDRAGRYCVQFSNGTSMHLYRQTVEDFALYAGLEMSESEYQRLLDAASNMSAKMRAVRIISATSISKQALEKRLVQKGEQTSGAKEAVTWLEELNLLDDRKTAEQIVHSCISKGYGRSRAKQALYEKQIPKEIWDSVLKEYPDQSEKIHTFLRTKLNRFSDDRERKRAIDALIRRGHSYHAIREALAELDLETDDLPEDE